MILILKKEQTFGSFFTQTQLQQKYNIMANNFTNPNLNQLKTQSVEYFYLPFYHTDAKVHNISYHFLKTVLISSMFD